jgi:hypothetical protein
MQERGHHGQESGLRQLKSRGRGSWPQIRQHNGALRRKPSALMEKLHAGVDVREKQIPLPPGSILDDHAGEIGSHDEDNGTGRQTVRVSAFDREALTGAEGFQAAEHEREASEERDESSKPERIAA